jgi:hypothetical protein
VAGPLKLERVGQRLRVAFNRHLSLWGGLALSMPIGTEHLRRRTFWYVGGGPAMSVLTGIAALLVAVQLTGVGAALTALSLFGIASLGIGFVTLFPGTTSGFATDGARLLALLRGGEEAARETAAMGLTNASLAGIRPRDWNLEWIETLRAAPPDTLHGFVGRQMAFHSALDAGQVEEADGLIERLLRHLDIVPKPLRPDFLLDAVYFVARHRDDPDHARALLADSDGGFWVSSYKRPLAEAATAHAEGDVGAASEWAREARAELGSALDRGQAVAAEERLDELDELLDGEVLR